MKIKYLIVIASFLAFYFFMPRNYVNQGMESLQTEIVNDEPFDLLDLKHECLAINDNNYCNPDVQKSKIIPINKILLKENLNSGQLDRFVNLSGSLYAEYHYAKFAEIINWLYFERNVYISMKNPKFFLISALENLKLKDFDRALGYIDDLKYFVNNYENSKDEYWLKGCCDYDIDWFENIKEHDTYKSALILEKIVRDNRYDLNESLLKQEIDKLNDYDDTPNTVDFIENVQFIILKAFDMSLHDHFSLSEKTDILVNSFDLYGDRGFYTLSSQIDIVNYLKLIELDKLIDLINIEQFIKYDKERNLERIYALMNYLDLYYKFNGKENKTADSYLRSALKGYQNYDCNELMSRGRKRVKKTSSWDLDDDEGSDKDNICEINKKFSSRIDREYNNRTNDIELVDYEKISKKDSLSFFYNVYQLVNIEHFKNSTTILDGDRFPSIDDSKFNSFHKKIKNHPHIKKYPLSPKPIINNNLLQTGEYKYLHVSNKDLFQIYYHLFRAVTGGTNDIKNILRNDERNEKYPYMLSTYLLLDRSLNYLSMYQIN